MPYGSFWRRVSAYLIDITLLALLYGALYGMPVEIDPELQAPAGCLYGLIVAWIYFAAMESSQEQGSIGKLAMGLRVTDVHGRRIGFTRASARHFAKILSTLVLHVGFLMVLFTERKQGLHDKLAGTLVLRGRPHLIDAYGRLRLPG